MKAIRALDREHGLTESELDTLIRQEFSASDLDARSLRQARGQTTEHGKVNLPALPHPLPGH